MTDAVSSPAAILIRHALETLRGVWDDALDPPITPGNGSSTGPQESQPPMPLADTDERFTAVEVLYRYARRIRAGLALCTHFPTEHGSVCLLHHQSLRGAHSVPELIGWMVPHAEWLAVRYPEAVVDLSDAAAALDAIAHPVRPEELYIGKCTVGADQGHPCGARLSWPTGAVELTCPGCGMVDGLAGWERRILGPPEHLHEVPPVPAPVVVLFVASRFGQAITEEVVRQWASRAEGRGGRTPTGVRRHGKTAAGATLYSLGEVREWCLQLYSGAPGRA